MISNMEAAVCIDLALQAAAYRLLPLPTDFELLPPAKQVQAAGQMILKLRRAAGTGDVMAAKFLKIMDRQLANGGTVLVPEPPPLTLRPKSREALVTVAAGTVGRDLLQMTRPLMAKYAKRVGVDFVVTDWPGHPLWPMSAKFSTWRVLEHYDRIVTVDADVLLRPASLNLFDACQPDEFGACDELSWHRPRPKGGAEQNYRQHRRALGFADGPVRWYFNCGVLVVPRNYQAIIAPPDQLMPPHHCAEQDLINARLDVEVTAGKVRLRMLDRRCNWQWWTDPRFVDAPPDAVLHVNGLQWEGEDKRIAAIQALLHDPAKKTANAHPHARKVRKHKSA